MRRFLLVILPVLLPFLLYGLYVWLARRKARRAGDAEPPGWERMPWHWILSAGVLLLAATLLVTRQFSGVPPGVHVEAPHIEVPQEDRQMPAGER